MQKIQNFNALISLLIIAILGYLLFLIIQPFVPAIVLGLTFAIIFYPVKKYFDKKLPLSNEVASIFTVLLTVVFIILPIISLVVLIGNEAINFAKTVNIETLQQEVSQLNSIQFLNYEIDLASLKDSAINSIQSIGAYLSAKSLSIVSAVGNSVFMFFVFLLLYFYFLKDSKKLLADLQSILPYSKTQQKKLFTSFQEISKTVFYGNLISAVLAGIIAYVGFTVFGFGGALIWALLAAVLSFIPTAGTLLVYLAGIALLVFMAGWQPALLMLAYFVLIELVFRENYLKGKILEDKLRFHPIIVFFALVGGVGAFGSLGLIYGPLIITFLGTLYRFHSQKA